MTSIIFEATIYQHSTEYIESGNAVHQRVFSALLEEALMAFASQQQTHDTEILVSLVLSYTRLWINS